MNIKTAIGQLRLAAYLEGISYLSFAITMPLKYGLGIREPNLYVGMAHGWLFIVYIALCIRCVIIYDWKSRDSLLAFIASIIPFGTFYMDHRLFRKTEMEEA